MLLSFAPKNVRRFIAHIKSALQLTKDRTIARMNGCVSNDEMSRNKIDRKMTLEKSIDIKWRDFCMARKLAKQIARKKK